MSWEKLQQYDLQTRPWSIFGKEGNILIGRISQVHEWKPQPVGWKKCQDRIFLELYHFKFATKVISRVSRKIQQYGLQNCQDLPAEGRVDQEGLCCTWCVYCQIFSSNTFAICRNSSFYNIFSKYSQISIAEACTSFSEELILNVIPAHVIASICVALTDDLRVKAWYKDSGGLASYC